MISEGKKHVLRRYCYFLGLDKGYSKCNQDCTAEECKYEWDKEFGEKWEHLSLDTIVVKDFLLELIDNEISEMSDQETARVIVSMEHLKRVKKEKNSKTDSDVADIVEKTIIAVKSVGILNKAVKDVIHTSETLLTFKRTKPSKLLIPTLNSTISKIENVKDNIISSKNVVKNIADTLTADIQDQSIEDIVDAIEKYKICRKSMNEISYSLTEDNYIVDTSIDAKESSYSKKVNDAFEVSLREISTAMECIEEAEEVLEQISNNFEKQPDAKAESFFRKTIDALTCVHRKTQDVEKHWEAAIRNTKDTASAVKSLEVFLKKECLRERAILFDKAFKQANKKIEAPLQALKSVAKAVKYFAGCSETPETVEERVCSRKPTTTVEYVLRKITVAEECIEVVVNDMKGIADSIGILVKSKKEKSSRGSIVTIENVLEEITITEENLEIAVKAVNDIAHTVEDRLKEENRLHQATATDNTKVDKEINPHLELFGNLILKTIAPTIYEHLSYIIQNIYPSENTLEKLLYIQKTTGIHKASEKFKILKDRFNVRIVNNYAKPSKRYTYSIKEDIPTDEIRTNFYRLSQVYHDVSFVMHEGGSISKLYIDIITYLTDVRKNELEAEVKFYRKYNLGKIQYKDLCSLRNFYKAVSESGLKEQGDKVLEYTFLEKLYGLATFYNILKIQKDLKEKRQIERMVVLMSELREFGYTKLHEELFSILDDGRFIETCNLIIKNYIAPISRSVIHTFLRRVLTEMKIKNTDLKMWINGLGKVMVTKGDWDTKVSKMYDLSKPYEGLPSKQKMLELYKKLMKITNDYDTEHLPTRNDVIGFDFGMSTYRFPDIFFLRPNKVQDEIKKSKRPPRIEY